MDAPQQRRLIRLVKLYFDCHESYWQVRHLGGPPCRKRFARWKRIEAKLRACLEKHQHRS